MCLPRDATRLHVIGQCDVIRPYIKLPLAKTKHTTQNGTRMDSNAHVQINLRNEHCDKHRTVKADAHSETSTTPNWIKPGFAALNQQKRGSWTVSWSEITDTDAEGIPTAMYWPTGTRWHIDLHVNICPTVAPPARIPAYKKQVSDAYPRGDSLPHLAVFSKLLASWGAQKYVNQWTRYQHRRISDRALASKALTNPVGAVGPTDLPSFRPLKKHRYRCKAGGHLTHISCSPGYKPWYHRGTNS